MYTIVKEMLMNGVPVPNIWVAQDGPDDPILTFDTEVEADSEAAILQAADSTGRKYKSSMF